MMFAASASLAAGKTDRLAGCSWLLAFGLLLLPCLVQLGVMVSLLAGRAGLAAVFPISLLAALGAVGWLGVKSGIGPSRLWTLVAVVLLLVVASLAVSAFFFDLSWDGEWYHQTGIIHIAQDWNPLTDPMHSFNPHLELWVRHYAKGPWYFAAAVDSSTGHIEWGKAINWLVLAAAFAAVFAACLNAGLRRRHALAIALVVAINPVVMSEVTTYLVDAVMISALVVAAAALFTCLHRPSALAVLAGAVAAIVAINAKFTGLVDLCVFLAVAALWCAIKHRDWFLRFAGISLASLFFGVCVWGYNPYVTNTWYRHQPFYPLLGSRQYPSLEQQNRDPNERWETPKNMVGRALPVRFVYATFGRPGNQPYLIGRNALLMWPFAAVPADLYAYKYHETRVAGFGPFFSGCLIFTFLLGIAMVVTSPSSRWPVILMAAAIIGSLSLSRHLWWPRYGPQFWLLPILPLAFALRPSVSGYRLIAARAVLCLLIANALIVAFVRLQWETTASLTLRHQLQAMRGSGQAYDVQTMNFVESTNLRLREAGVQFHEVGMAKLPGAQELMSVVEGYPQPVHYRLAPQVATAPDPPAPR